MLDTQGQSAGKRFANEDKLVEKDTPMGYFEGKRNRRMVESKALVDTKTEDSPLVVELEDRLIGQGIRVGSIEKGSLVEVPEDTQRSVGNPVGTLSRNQVGWGMKLAGFEADKQSTVCLFVVLASV